MTHYHGTPITPSVAAAHIMAGRHAMVSYAHPEQVELMFDCCQSVSFDNGAFSAWRAGKPIKDWHPYYLWVKEWMHHPSFDFALIPDIIDGSERDNDTQISIWGLGKQVGCPIWHLHESLHKLENLCNYWPRVAIGSSGDYAVIGTPSWWDRMSEAMETACPFGWPKAKLHGLRMLDTDIFTKFPFSSADSTNVARNVGMDRAWKGPYEPATKAGRGVVIAERIEAFQSAARWVSIETQQGLFTEAQ